MKTKSDNKYPMKRNQCQAQVKPVEHPGCSTGAHPRLSPPAFLALILTMIGLLTASAFGGSEYWNTSAGALTSGSGTWDAGISSFWSPTTAGATLTTWTADSDAFFVTGGANTVTLSGLVQANSLQQATNGTVTTINTNVVGDIIRIDSNTGILNGVGSGNQTLTINAPITLNSPNVTMNAAQAITINGPIGDGGKGYGITELGANFLNLGASNTFTGPTLVQQGTLSVTVF